MTVYHFSAECYPVAKVGGLADVVGALPKYQNKIPDVEAKVVMPWYDCAFTRQHDFEMVFDGFIHQNNGMYQVQVLREKQNVLGFELFMVRIPGLLDRERPYGYWDEQQQFLSFQHGALHWLSAMEIRPEVLHCHDYHTGLIPFMVEHCVEFSFLKGIKTIGTIHNGEYQGRMDWEMLRYFPWVDDARYLGLLDWDGFINPLAAMIKCCHAFNTVSGGYMDELFHQFQGLESLVSQEYEKAHGIINGIDTAVWNPATDPMIPFQYTKENAREGKRKNKEQLCSEYGLNPDLPLFGFIGRFAGEKGADLLPEIVWKSLQQTHNGHNLMVLGSGDPRVEDYLKDLNHHFPNFALDLGYKEALSHKIYASCDFLLMPSRVEPCGLNQIYAMRYGTIPIVRHTGGLKDTVEDITTGGAGLSFAYASADDAVNAIHRALQIYGYPDLMTKLIESNMNFDFSWEKSAENYVNLYRK
ncbi:glycogen synthase [Bergeyella sp. RCAD1439]|uniref:glycogen synthase n=1 Tax=Bergeyella anatis TaxID=3113737 RepID=UPI002E16D4D8|nr:glycogen/starch synthase [Bergeyella sp. RCAD1439]